MSGSPYRAPADPGRPPGAEHLARSRTCRQDHISDARGEPACSNCGWRAPAPSRGGPRKPPRTPAPGRGRAASQ